MLLVDQHIEAEPATAFAADLELDEVRARSETKIAGLVACCAYCLQAFELVGMPCDAHATDEERREREVRLAAAQREVSP